MKRFSTFRRLSLWFAFFALFSLQACVHVPERKAGPCHQTAATCQRALDEISKNYHTLSGHARITVTSPDGKISFSGDLYAHSPDRLHFDIFGFLHRPRFLLIKSGDLIAWKDFDSGRYYEGPLEACPAFPVKFPFSPSFLRDFMRILFVNFPGPIKVTRPGHPENSCHFLLRCAWGVFDMKADPVRGLPREVIGPKNGHPPFHLSFSDYQKSPAGWVPHQLEIVAGKVEMTVAFNTLTVNSRLPNKVFIPLVNAAN